MAGKRFRRTRAIVGTLVLVGCSSGPAVAPRPSAPTTPPLTTHRDAEIEARVIRGARPHSADELAQRFLAALQSDDQAEMTRLFVTDRWFVGVCPWAGSPPDPQLGRPPDGDHIAAMPVGRAVLQEVGPCEVVRVVVPSTVGPVSHTDVARGRACESEYQEARDVTAVLRCREDRSVCFNLNDVAVVRGVWAVRDKAQWGVCRGDPERPGFERLCDRQGDIELCRRIQATLAPPFARAMAH